MTSPELYAEIDLPGIHTVRIYDHSRVYFGDYYRVRLEVVCEIPLPLDSADPAAEAGDPPHVAVYSRFLERMAVPSAAVADIRLALVAEFRQNSLQYLTAAAFPAKLVARTAARQTVIKKRYVASPG